MKSTIEQVNKLSRRMNIEIPAEVVQQTMDKMLRDIQAKADLKGFRKGKAPMTMIKSMYADRVKQDAVQELIQMHYFQALKEHNIDPISYPEFEFAPLTEAQNFSFSASFDVRPTVELKKTEGLEVEREKFVLTEDRVDKVIENIRSARATTTDVLEDRACAMGDIAIINFEGFVDGNALEGGKGENHPLELGAKQFIDGFEEAVVGMKVGDSRKISLKFPDPYHSMDLAGKPVEFQVTLTKLQKKVLPEMDEAFFQTLGMIKDVEQLKQTIREDIERTEQKRIQGDFHNALLKALIQANPVDVPARMLEEQKQGLIEDSKKRLAEQGMTDEDFKKYVEKWNADFEKTAAEMIQSSFIVDAIAAQNNLRCTDLDFTKKLQDYAVQTGIDVARVEEYYGKPELASRLRFQITEEKVLEFLTSKAKIKEVTKA